MPLTTYDAQLEAWVDEAVAMEQNMEALYGPPATPPTLPPLTTYDGLLEAIVDACVGVKDKLLDQSPIYHNKDSAYVKTVPAHTSQAELQKIGGKTVVWNQLLNTLATDTYTTNDITFTVNADKSITISGTATDMATYMCPASVFDYFPLVAGHKYYHYVPTGVLWGDRNGRIGGNTGIKTANVSNTNNMLYFRVLSGTTVNVTFYPMIHDLTLMFGAGNEPTTVAEFQQMFPASYYSYNAGTLLSAGVTEVVSKKADTTEIATYPIPAEIQALEGYGWSAGTVFNYIDYERKVFVKCVDRVVLDGTQTSITNVNWRANENGVGWIYPYSVAPCKIPLTANGKANLICAELPTNTYNNLYGQQVGVGVYVDNSRSIVIWQSNTSLTTSSAINTYLTANPITVYYELATPVEVDISAYITDDNLIEVEAGGTLTFENQNGDDYRIPVPSEVLYDIDVS